MAAPLNPRFILNLAAGNGYVAKHGVELKALFRSHFPTCDVQPSGTGDHASLLAARASHDGYNAVVAVGGDGCTHYVAQGLAGNADALPLGVIPVGTGGDYRRSLGLEHRLDAYLQTLARGHTRLVDTLVVDHTNRSGVETSVHVLNVASVGMGGWVDDYVRSAPRALGAGAAYYFASLRGLVSTPLLALRVTVDGEVHNLETRMLALCKGSYFGAGMHIAPHATLDSGLVELVALTQRTRAGFLTNSQAIYSGKHLGREGTWAVQGREVLVEVAPQHRTSAKLDLDGEPAGAGSFRVRVAPGSLRVFAGATTETPFQ